MFICIEATEGETINFNLKLTCSISGSTSISYSIAENTFGTKSYSIPDWVSLDSGSQKLIVDAPEYDKTIDNIYSCSIRSQI
jgi:hypothetical protein